MWCVCTSSFECGVYVRPHIPSSSSSSSLCACSIYLCLSVSLHISFISPFLLLSQESLAKLLNIPTHQAIVFVSSRDLVRYFDSLLAKETREQAPAAPSTASAAVAAPAPPSGKGKGRKGNNNNNNNSATAQQAPVFERELGDTPLFFLQGGAAQADRLKAFTSFCKAETGVLFCTDVAARGLDLPKVGGIEIIRNIACLCVCDCLC